jgi:hypothetical protein
MTKKTPLGGSTHVYMLLFEKVLRKCHQLCHIHIVYLLHKNGGRHLEYTTASRKLNGIYTLVHRMSSITIISSRFAVYKQTGQVDDVRNWKEYETKYIKRFPNPGISKSVLRGLDINKEIQQYSQWANTLNRKIHHTGYNVTQPLHTLGKGGFAVVVAGHRVNHLSIKPTNVAIKLTAIGHGVNAKEKEEIMEKWLEVTKEEHRIADECGKQGIGPVIYDKGVMDYTREPGISWTISYLIMGLYTSDLKNWMDNQASMSLPQWVKQQNQYTFNSEAFLRLLVTRIKKLVEIGYVHTDLKAENVLIRTIPDQADGMDKQTRIASLVLTDFGVNGMQKVSLTTPTGFKRLLVLYMLLQIIYQHSYIPTIILFRHWLTSVIQAEGAEIGKLNVDVLFQFYSTGKGHKNTLYYLTGGKKDVLQHTIDSIYRWLKDDIKALLM